MARPMRASTLAGFSTSAFASILIAVEVDSTLATGNIGMKNGVHDSPGGSPVAGAGSGAAGAGWVYGTTRCHQLAALARWGATDDSTSCCCARVMATYSAFSSSRARAVCSVSSAATAQAGGWPTLRDNGEGALMRRWDHRITLQALPDGRTLYITDCP